MNTNELIAALSDSAVTTAFAAALQPILLELIETIISPLRQEVIALQSQVETLDRDRDSLVLENDNLRIRLDALEAKVASLPSTQMDSSRLDALESYTRVDNLIIKGLPDSVAEAVLTTSHSDLTSNDNLLARVVDLFESKLNVTTSPSDISVVHRLPKGRYDRTRPVIVRFSNRRVRDKIYAARHCLSTINRTAQVPIYINEQLSRKNEELFAECRKLWKAKVIGGTWTWHGCVFAKSNIQDSRAVKIQDSADILKVK